MSITVLFFGPLAELTGSSAIELTGVADTEAATQAVVQQFPSLQGRTYALALDQVLVRTPTPVTDGATLAFLPPFSGG